MGGRVLPWIKRRGRGWGLRLVFVGFFVSRRVAGDRASLAKDGPGYGRFEGR